MIPEPQDRKFFWVSLAFHLGVLLIFVLGLDQFSSLIVFENTNKQDVISAVVLGDTEKSRVLPKEAAPVAPAPPQVKKVIPLKKPDHKKKLADKKIKDLLKDIQMESRQQKLKQKKLQDQFEKMLKAQAEKTLRQQLLDEKIRLKGAQLRQAQGQVNKYKALILQAISEHWIVPVQANRNLTCELMIRTAPSGSVIDVHITKTSGDPSLDSSARAAVLKASPLPVPKNADAFQSFKQFVLKVKPENIVEVPL